MSDNKNIIALRHAQTLHEKQDLMRATQESDLSVDESRQYNMKCCCHKPKTRDCVRREAPCAPGCSPGGSPRAAPPLVGPTTRAIRPRIRLQHDQNTKMEIRRGTGETVLAGQLSATVPWYVPWRYNSTSTRASLFWSSCAQLPMELRITCNDISTP